GDAASVHRTGAAERVERPLGRIVAALGAVPSEGERHLLVDRGADAHGGRQRIAAESDRQRPLGRGGVEPHPSTQECLDADVAEHYVGVRDGWVRIAPRRAAGGWVAGRSRLRAGALRTDLEPTQPVDPRDRAATRADLDELDARHLQRETRPLREAIDAGHLDLRRDVWPDLAVRAPN